MNVSGSRLAYLVQWAIFGAVVAFLYAPLIALALVSFSSGRVTEFPPPGFTLHWYTRMFADPRALQSVITSVAIGIISAILSTALATCFAFALHRRRSKWVTLVRALGSLPLVMAPLVIGVSLLLFVNMIGLSLGYLSVAVTHTVRGFPFAAVIMTTAFLAVKGNLVEAALDLGATHLSTFRRVILPAIMPGLVASLLVAFAVSFDEISATTFVAGGGVSTVQTFILEQIQFVVTPEMNALTTLILVATGIPAIVANYLRERKA